MFFCSIENFVLENTSFFVFFIIIFIIFVVVLKFKLNYDCNLNIVDKI